MIVPMVIGSIGLLRGTVTMRVPSVITMCLPYLLIQKPAFGKARTASR